MSTGNALFDGVLRIGALAGAIHAMVALTSYFRRRIPYPIAQDARAALHRASYVFDSVSSSGGYLGHPWQVPDGETSEDRLANQLRALQASLRGRHFRRCLDDAIGALRDVYANSPTPKYIFNLEGAKSAAEIESERVDAARADRQRSAGERGTQAVSAALKLVDRRSAKH